VTLIVMAMLNDGDDGKYIRAVIDIQFQGFRHSNESVTYMGNTFVWSVM